MIDRRLPAAPVVPQYRSFLIVSEQIKDAEKTATPEKSGTRGSNQSGMRAYNERLVLTLVRKHKALPKSDIAKITGLSAQTVSVIMRSLEEEGLLKRGEPQRGKVGQPSIPMSLAPDGAYFYGLKIGRRSSEMVLLDFEGTTIGRTQLRHAYPTPAATIAFTKSAAQDLGKLLTPAQTERVAGMGVATPFELWSWSESIGAPEAEMDKWRGFDMEAELSAASGYDVLIQNDATAACGAELVFGTNAPRDFLHIYLGFFIGGGVVLNGTLFTGIHGSSGSMGPMPLPTKEGGTRQLLEIASLVTLEKRINDAGGDGMALWPVPLNWDIDQDILDPWISEVGEALAFAIVASASIIDFESCLIDGWMPEPVREQVVNATQESLAKMNTTGLILPRIKEGTVGADARSLGAASLPLSSRFLLDQNAFLKDI